MRRTVLSVLILIALLFIFLRFVYKPLTENLGISVRSGIMVDSDKTSKVFINDNEVGTTPYRNNDLSEGQVKVKIVDTASNAAWDGNVKLSGGTLTVVNRDIATSSAESSGEIISLEKGKGLTITSTPAGATVALDGETKGVTPLFIADVSAGEHQFLLSKENYLKRSIRSIITDGYSLTLNVDLAQLEQVLAEDSSPLPVETTEQLTVLQTPNGFLRVRETPSTTGKEITRVTTGTTLNMLEETNDEWFKVRLSDGKEGYVSSEYVEKKE